MGKKFLAVLLSVAMLATLLAAPASAVEFPDAQGSWAKSSIDRWSDAQIVEGDDLGNINPDKPLRRAELATILVRLLGLTEKAPMGTFTDVPAGVWYEDAILKCAAAGIMQGYAGHVDPLDDITREQAITMVGRALGVKPQSDQSLDRFSDAGRVSPYAQQYMAPLTAMGILQGVGDGSRVAPKDSIDRASALALLDKAIGRYVTRAGNVTVNNANTFVVVNVQGAKAGDEVIISGTAAGVAVTTGNTADVKLDGITANTVKVDAPVDVSVATRCDLGDVTLNAPAELAVERGAQVDNVTVATTAANAAVTNNGTIDTVTANAAVDIDNQGTLNELKANARGVVIKGTDAVKTTAAESVSVDNSGTKAPSTSSGSSGGSSGGRPSRPSTPAVADATITFIATEADYDAEYGEGAYAAVGHDVRLPWILVKYTRNQAGTVEFSVKKDGTAVRFGTVTTAEDGTETAEYSDALSADFTAANPNAYVSFHMYSQAETDHKGQDWLDQIKPETETETVYQVTVKMGTTTVTASATYPTVDKTALTEAIAAATAAAEAITVDTSAANVAVGTKWILQADKDAYEAAIKAAQAVADKTDAKVSEVSAAVTALAEATTAFEAAQKDGEKTEGEEPGPGPEVNKTALTEAIVAANAAAGAIIVDTDAANVTVGTKWILQADKDTYTAAIAAAQTVADKADATQDEVDAAVATLAEATTAFETAQKDGAKEKDPNAADKTALTAAIATANAAAGAITVDTDAANVAVGTKWILQADKDTYTAAIATAQTVADKADATQDEVDAAVATLAEATTAFETAQKDGTKEPVVDPDPVNKDALTAAITAANAAAGAITVDTDAANVAVGTKWVLQADKDTYTAAIAAAQAVVDKVDATQDEVDTAVTALAEATTAFEAAQKDGAKEPVVEPDPVNKDALTAAITAANAAAGAITVDTDAANVAVGTKWITAEDKATYEAAIAAAQAVIDKTDATQDEVDAAVTALAEATTAFEAAQKDGEKTETPDPTPVNKDDLHAAIGAASLAKDDTVVSADGTGVTSDKFWVTQDALDALLQAIADATAVDNDENATQEQVDAAKLAVEEAATTFTSGKQQGTEPPAVEPEPTEPTE